MMRWITAVLLMPIVISATTYAADKTPYKFIFGGNSYSGSRNASVRWLADRYDAAIAGTSDWPGLHDSIYDACKAMGKEFWDGPYASSQEINLYERANPGAQYNDRLRNVREHWLYVYAKRYLDSIGVSAESLVVHIADDNVSITNAGDGQRTYILAGLPHHKKRFTYQYWNNTSSDTMFYPAGYCWLANGYNANARKAIAYAYRRYILEDSTLYGPGDHHWGAYFMDNQYRQGTSPRLSSYYTINSTSGGPTGGLDWKEQSGIGNDVVANTQYYDRSTMLIDSTIAATLDSVCRARSLKPVRGFANVDKCWPSHLSVQIKYTNVTLENPVDYTKAWPNGWAMWYDMADTMAAHPDRYIVWMFLGDFLCSNNPADWKYDSSRIYMTHYAFFLQVRDTNAFMGPCRFNDTTRWREIYELDLGEPDGPAYEVSSTGSGYTRIAVMRRDYDNGQVAVLVRTAYGTADYVNDSVAVNLHKLYREITSNADTLAQSDSIFYMKPYSGRILAAADQSAVPPSAPVLSSPATGSSVSTTPILCAVNANRPMGSGAVTYQFEIALDAAFTNGVRQSAWLAETAGTTCFSNSAPLATGRRYYWRCRAANSAGAGAWSGVFNFVTPNGLPPAPTCASPLADDTVSLRQPTLVVNTVSDPDGTPVVYHFELSRAVDFATVDQTAGPISPAGSIASWQPAILQQGNTYFWRSRGYDGLQFGPWMNTASFVVDTLHEVNLPPSPPELLAPTDNDTVVGSGVTLSAKKATDPNSDPLSYEFVLHEDSVQAAPIDSISGVVPLYSSTEVLWQVTTPLRAGKVYFWSCRAFDGAKRSPWAGHRRFWTPSGDTIVVVNPPVADFDNSPHSGYAPLIVGFSDRSTNNPASWRWDFGDGRISTEQSPAHTYATSGVYTVALTVTNAAGSDTKTVPDLITVIEPQLEGIIYSSGERTMAGTVSGSYADTRESDGSCQVLTEAVSRPGTMRTYSLVDHRWRFMLSPTQWKTLFVTARRSDNGDRDDFCFEYSLNDTIFIPLLVVNSPTDRIYSAAIPGNVSGSVTIRVIDTDRSRYKTSLDQVSVDQMYIESSNGTRPPDTLFVQEIDLTVPPGTSVNYYARAAVTIFNQRNAPASGVEVTGHFEGPSADIVTGVTGIDGRVIFKSAKIRNPVGVWSFHIDAVSRDGDIYGADRNVETYDQAKAAVIPEQFELFQNYPNPFNPTTRIEFSLPQPVTVRLQVYNIAGQVVQTLIDEQLDAGFHGVVWDGRDGDGRPVASGIYFYRLQTAEFTATCKMALLK